MAVICPTITVETPQAYAAQLATIKGFATRIHIDIADSVFTPRKLLTASQIYLPEGIACDIHVMLEDPLAELMTLISLRPELVVVHAESKGDIAGLLEELQKVGIKAGIALLPDTTVAQTMALLAGADHALVFAGHLGYQGGTADMGQMAKVKEIRNLRPDIEIAWDGGINARNARVLAAAGVDVLNVGGAIHKAENPRAAFRELSNLVENI